MPLFECSFSLKLGTGSDPSSNQDNSNNNNDGGSPGGPPAAQNAPSTTRPSVVLDSPVLGNNSIDNIQGTNDTSSLVESMAPNNPNGSNGTGENGVQRNPNDSNGTEGYIEQSNLNDDTPKDTENAVNVDSATGSDVEEEIPDDTGPSQYQQNPTLQSDLDPTIQGLQPQANMSMTGGLRNEWSLPTHGTRPSKRAALNNLSEIPPGHLKRSLPSEVNSVVMKRGRMENPSDMQPNLSSLPANLDPDDGGDGIPAPIPDGVTLSDQEMYTYPTITQLNELIRTGKRPSSLTVGHKRHGEVHFTGERIVNGMDLSEAVKFKHGGVEISSRLDNDLMVITFFNLTRVHFAQLANIVDRDMTDEELSEVLESLSYTIGAVHHDFNETDQTWIVTINRKLNGNGNP